MTKADLNNWVNFHNLKKEYKTMTIINNIGVEEIFDNLAVGTVFKSRDNYYIVINEAREIIEDEDICDCPVINAINLVTGNSTHFSYMDKVTVIKNPKLVIE